MFNKALILAPALLLAAAPFAASAESMSASELQMFHAATVTLAQASATATQTHPGTLASISFGDENGTPAYSAVVVGADGQPWTVVIDASNGTVIHSAAGTDDEQNGTENASEDGENGSENQGENGEG